MFNKIDRAKFWLDNGFYLLPCQVNSKSLVAGFGQYRNKISDIKTACAWWDKKGSSANMAVLVPDNFYILDFDILDVYARWVQLCPAGARSYTEITPRGGTHVFLRGTPPTGSVLITGAEIKKIVLVAPSVVDGKEYQSVSNVNFASPDPVDVLSSLSAPGHATPNFLRADQARRNSFPAGTRINEIKRHYTISHVLNLYRSGIKTDGIGNWKTCACPFHNDRKPSFYFNDELGVWGCHACGVRGDVINLYARFEAVSLQEAIKLSLIHI